MDRSEFCGLPLPIALGLLFDAVSFTNTHLESAPAPEKPRCPKYDLRIYRKGGYQWASETTVESLEFWHKRAAEGAESGSQWAEKDAKTATALERWIAWRQWYPDAIWKGTRNDEENTKAAAPHFRAEVHSTELRPSAQAESMADDGYDYSEDGALPF